MTITLAKWTIDEYHSMIEAGLLDNRQVELLQGEIVEISPEGEAHAYFGSEAEEYLRELLGNQVNKRIRRSLDLKQGNLKPKSDRRKDKIELSVIKLDLSFFLN